MPYHCPNKLCNAFNRYSPHAGPCPKCGVAKIERPALLAKEKK